LQLDTTVKKQTQQLNVLKEITFGCNTEIDITNQSVQLITKKGYRWEEYILLEAQISLEKNNAITVNCCNTTNHSLLGYKKP